MPDNPTNLTTVFFSYSRTDQEKALPIINAIEEAGFKVWWDGLLEVGSNFLETTEEALESAKAVVVLWSKTSIASHWVRDEATSGRERSRLVPLSLDGTQPPLGFRQVQFIDIQNWQGNPKNPSMQELFSVLSELHGRPSRAKTESLARIEKPKSVSMLSKRKLLIGGAIGIGGLLTGGGITVHLMRGQNSRLTNSLAVLPFENLSGKSEYDFIADGLASEIRNSLSQNQALTVAARSSSIAAAKEKLDIRQISKKLNVANIIEGQTNVFGDMVRVTVTFVECETGFSKWSKSFEHGQDDILTIHDNITQAIHDTFSLNYANDFIDGDGQTQNPAAFNEYLKGENQIKSSLSENSMELAISHYNSALTLDPKFGAALISKSQLLFWKGVSSSDLERSKTLRQKAMNTAKEAVMVSSSYSAAHNNLGYLYFNAEMDIKNASASFAKASKLGARKAGELTRYASFATFTGDNEAALKAAKLAMDLDPLNITIKEILGIVHFAGERYEEALKLFQEISQSQPERILLNARIAHSQIFMNKLDQARIHCEKETYDLGKQTCQAFIHIADNNLKKTQDSLNAIIDNFGDYAAYQLAQIHAFNEDEDKAIQWLIKAYDLNDSAMTQMYIDPFLKSIRNNPNYKSLLAKIGFSK